MFFLKVGEEEEEEGEDRKREEQNEGKALTMAKRMMKKMKAKTAHF